MWRGIDQKVGKPALDGVALLDAGEDVSEVIVLTVDRQPGVNDTCASKQPTEEPGTQAVLVLRLREGRLRSVDPGVGAVCQVAGKQTQHRKADVRAVRVMSVAMKAIVAHSVRPSILREPHVVSRDDKLRATRATLRVAV